MNLEENALTQRRAELERSGARIIDLSASNPTAVGLSPTGLTLPAVDVYEPDAQGLPAAREAIGRFTGTPPDRLVLGASTSEAYGWLLKLLCAPDSDVLVPAPGYPLLDVLAELERVTLRRYPLRYDDRWCTDAPLVEGAASPRTKAVVAVSPGNPTGTYLSAGETDALARLCAARGWALIIDEVFAGPRPPRDWPCRCFTLGGLSKSVGLPQLKLAWTGVHGPGALDAVHRLSFIADAYLSVSGPVQHAAAELLEQHAGPFRERVALRCSVNRAELARALPADWQLLDGDAGWSAVLRVPATDTEEARCLAALERGVFVHPGWFYDFPSGAHLVLSLLAAPAQFAEGVRRLLGAA